MSIYILFTKFLTCFFPISTFLGKVLTLSPSLIKAKKIKKIADKCQKIGQIPFFDITHLSVPVQIQRHPSYLEQNRRIIVLYLHR